MANLPGPKEAVMYSNALFIDKANRITDLTTNTTGDQTAALAGGYYDLWAAQDIFIRVDTNALVGLNSTLGYLVRANQTITVFVPDTHKIGGIASSTNTTTAIMKVG